MNTFECCGADDQGEHADACRIHFNRRTLQGLLGRIVDEGRERLAEAIEKAAAAQRNKSRSKNESNTDVSP